MRGATRAACGARMGACLREHDAQQLQSGQLHVHNTIVVLVLGAYTHPDIQHDNAIPTYIQLYTQADEGGGGGGGGAHRGSLQSDELPIHNHIIGVLS